MRFTYLHSESWPEVRQVVPSVLGSLPLLQTSHLAWSALRTVVQSVGVLVLSVQESLRSSRRKSVIQVWHFALLAFRTIWQLVGALSASAQRLWSSSIRNVLRQALHLLLFGSFCRVSQLVILV